MNYCIATGTHTRKFISINEYAKRYNKNEICWEFGVVLCMGEYFRRKNIGVAMYKNIFLSWTAHIWGRGR